MREMKDSGIEWIGKIPAYWTIKRLKYALSVPMAYGASETGIEFEEDFPRYIRITDIDSEGKLKEEGKLSLSPQIALPYILSDKTVLFARSGGTVGKAFLYKEEYGKAAYAGYLISAVADEDIMYPEWLMYYTGSNSYFDWVQRVFTQATIQNIGADKYSNMPLPIAPIQEQRIIIKHLNDKCSEIDEIKHSIDQEILMLENYKQSIISEAVTKGLNWQAEMQESGIRWCPNIPVHWKTDRGKFILQLLERPVYEDDGVITCFRDGEVTLRSNRREDGFTVSLQEAGYQGIEPGDLVVHGMDGFAGAIGISDSRGKGTPVLNVMDSQQNKRYLMYYLRWIAKIGVFESLSTGIRVRSCDTNWNKLRELPYIIPPIEEQNAIAKYLDEKCAKIDEAIADKRKLLDILDNYKKSLIFEYVTGKKEIL